MSILMMEYPDMKIFNSLTRIFTLTALLGAVTLCTALTKAAAQTPIFTIEGVYVDAPCLEASIT